MSPTVGVQWKAAAIERARSFEAFARFDLKHSGHPRRYRSNGQSNNRIAEKSRIEVVGPVAPIRKDSAIIVDVADEHVSCHRCHHQLHLAVAIGDPRPAG
jgi:hypothetical protein